MTGRGSVRFALCMLALTAVTASAEDGGPTRNEVMRLYFEHYNVARFCSIQGNLFTPPDVPKLRAAALEMYRGWGLTPEMAGAFILETERGLADRMKGDEDALCAMTRSFAGRFADLTPLDAFDPAEFPLVMFVPRDFE